MIQKHPGSYKANGDAAMLPKIAFDMLGRRMEILHNMLFSGSLRTLQSNSINLTNFA